MRTRTIAALITLTATPALLAGCGGSSTRPTPGSGTAHDPGADCQPAHHFDTISNGALTVASYDLPPYDSIKDGTIVGAEGDIVTKIAKMECLKLKPLPATAASAISLVQTGRADITSDVWWRSEARAKVVALSDPVLLDYMGIISKPGTNSLGELKKENIRIGTVNGYIWTSTAKKYFGDHLKLYKSALDMHQDLKSGRITAALGDYGTLKQMKTALKVKLADPNPTFPSTQQPPQTCFPVAKSNRALLNALNEDIATLKKNGAIKKILKAHDLPTSMADTGAPRLLK